MRSPQKQILSFLSILLSKSHFTDPDRYGILRSPNRVARLWFTLSFFRCQDCPVRVDLGARGT